MPLVSGSIPNFINGISQQPAPLRLPTQGSIQENALSSVVKGLAKRPPSEHVAKLSNAGGSNLTQSTDSFFHTIRRDENEAYALVVTPDNSDDADKLALFDLTGAVSTGAGSRVPICTFVDGCIETFADTTPTPSGAWQASQTHTLVAQTSTNGSGKGVKLSITTDGSGNPTVTAITDKGGNYAANNTLVITDPGDTTNTATLTVATISNANKKLLTSGGTDVATSYLTAGMSETGANASTDFTATTVADYTFIVNKRKTVLKDATTTAPVRKYEGMVFIKKGSYANKYKVRVKNSSGTLLFRGDYEVPQGVTETTSTNTIASGNITGTASEQTTTEQFVTTQHIAESIFRGPHREKRIDTSTNPDTTIWTDEPGSSERYLIVATGNGGTLTNSTTETYGYGSANCYPAPEDDAGQAFTGKTYIRDGISFQYQRDSSIIYFFSDTVDFKLEVEDGEGYGNILAFTGHNEVSTFTKLPPEGPPENFTIKVGGVLEKNQDDYYVYWNGDNWKETNEPKRPNNSDDDVRIKFDATTMPHQLYKAQDDSSGTVTGQANQIYFIYTTVNWDERKVGDENTNPFPSFAGYKINDIFFHRNRLGFLSDENVIFSETSSFFNLFATTVLTVVDSDPIDLAVSNNQVSILKHAVPFDESLIMFSDLQQFKLTSTDALTPLGATIDVATQFETSTEVKPVAAGKFVYFPFKRGSFSGMREYYVDMTTESNDAQEITAHCPEYLKGTVTKLVTSSNENISLVGTSDDKKNLYVYRWFWDNNQKLQSSWSKWIFDADVEGCTFLGSNIYILFNRSDALYLEKINLSSDDASSVMLDSQPVMLDRRVALKTGATTTVPYTSSDLQYVVETGEIIPASKLTSVLAQGTARWQQLVTAGTKSGTPTVYAGIPYTFKYRISEQVVKQDGETITSQITQLRNMSIIYNDTGYFQVEVQPTLRTKRTNRFTSLLVGAFTLGRRALQGGKYRFPILARTDKVTIDILNDTYLPCVFQSAEWEGLSRLRSQRI